MKNIIVCVFLTASFLFANAKSQAYQVSAGKTQEFKPLHEIVRVLIGRFKHNARLPVWTPIEVDDPLQIPPFELLDGNISLSEAYASGLSGFTDNFIMQTPAPVAKMSYSMNGIDITLDGQYKIELPNYFSFPVSGKGKLILNIKKPVLNTQFTVSARQTTGRPTLSDLVLDLGFDSMKIQADEFMLCGKSVDLASYDGLWKVQFDVLWGNMKKDVAAIVQLVMDGVIQQCTMEDLFEYNNFDCLGGFTNLALSNDDLAVHNTAINGILQNMAQDLCTSLGQPSSAMGAGHFNFALVFVSAVFLCMFSSQF